MSGLERNQYLLIQDRYPGYGIVTYLVDDDHVDAVEERTYFSETIQLCREQYGWAFQNQAIWDFGVGNQPVPVDLKWIVFKIVERPDEGADHWDFNAARSVAVLVQAQRVFDGSLDVDEIIAAGVRDEDPFRFDSSGIVMGRDGFSWKERAHFLIIERHMERERGQQESGK